MSNDDMNFSLIPGELSAPNKRRGLGHRARENESAGYHKDAFDVVDCGPSGAAPHEPGTKSAKPSSGAVSTTVGASASLPGKAPTSSLGKTGGAAKVSGDNYRAEYMRKQRENESVATGKSLTKEQAMSRTDQQNREVAERSRARDLSDQLQYWKNQQFSNEHDQGAVTGNIAQIEQQLNSIDQKFRQ